LKDFPHESGDDEGHREVANDGYGLNENHDWLALFGLRVFLGPHRRLTLTDVPHPLVCPVGTFVAVTAETGLDADATFGFAARSFALVVGVLVVATITKTARCTGAEDNGATNGEAEQEFLPFGFHDFSQELGQVNTMQRVVR
jgi:hypothetical protein